MGITYYNSVRRHPLEGWKLIVDVAVYEIM